MSFRRDGRSDLQLSLLLLSAVVVLALLGLAADANWPKIVRVASAFAAYCLLLYPYRDTKATPGVIRFMIAGAAAGLVSGLIRPEPMTVLFVGTQVAAGGFLLGPMHWLALRWQQRVRSRIVA